MRGQAEIAETPGGAGGFACLNREEKTGGEYLMSDDETLAAALTYAERGLYVFPVRLGVRGDGKKDVRPIDAWKSASSRDPEQITTWWTNGWAGAALAIDTGKSGLVVADQDVSDGKRGPENWEILGERSEFRVRTPSGGLHDYYRADPEQPVSVANRGEVTDGVDVRGDGGFVFAPPTRDPRGGSWEWELGEIPEDFSELERVPAVIPERLNAARATLRPKATEAQQASEDPLFSDSAGDYGPDGGWKTKETAGALLDQELKSFLALTSEGSARSHVLAQRLGVLAGHGIPAFWDYDTALSILMDACVRNGFTAAHGERYAESQARRGLDYGMTQPWHMRLSFSGEEPAPEPTADAVDALIAEMLNADQLQERPAPKYLIKGLLNLDSEAWTIGEPGCKKSFVVLDQAIHVVKGMPWRGLKVSQGPVVMIAAEGAAGMSTRVKAWQQEYGPIGEGFYMLPRPVQASNTGAWRVLAEACKRLGAVMVIIDTQARVTVGLKENDATDMGVYVHAVGVIREATGACVHTIHHTGRNGGDARGSSAIDGAQGTELKVVKKSAYAGMLTVEKQKDMEEIEDIPLNFKRVVVGQDEDGDEITSLVLVEGNVFIDAQGQEEPEQWQIEAPSVVEQIITVLTDHAGTRGMTKPEVKATVLERFHGGRADALEKSTWHTSWSRAVARDEVIMDSGRALIDPLADEEMS